MFSDDNLGAESLAEALGVVGDRWSLLVVAALHDGPARFGELSARIAGIAPNTLTARLRKLEQLGLVVTRPYSQRPRRLEYSLTADGSELNSAILALAQWGARRRGELGLAVDDACGAPLELRWVCPTTGEQVDNPRQSSLVYA